MPRRQGGGYPQAGSVHSAITTAVKAAERDPTRRPRSVVDLDFDGDINLDLAPTLDERQRGIADLHVNDLIHHVNVNNDQARNLGPRIDDALRFRAASPCAIGDPGARSIAWRSPSTLSPEAHRREVARRSVG